MRDLEADLTRLDTGREVGDGERAIEGERAMSRRQSFCCALPRTGFWGEGTWGSCINS